MPREIGALRYMSALGLIGSVVLTGVLVTEFFTNKAVVPDPVAKLDAAELFIFKVDNTIEVIPFIIFLYMYQALLP